MKKRKLRPQIKAGLGFPHRKPAVPHHIQIWGTCQVERREENVVPQAGPVKCLPFKLVFWRAQPRAQPDRKKQGLRIFLN